MEKPPSLLPSELTPPDTTLVFDGMPSCTSPFRSSNRHRSADAGVLRSSWLRPLLGLALLVGTLLLNVHIIGHIDKTQDAPCDICLLAGGLNDAVNSSISWQPDQAPFVATLVGRTSAFKPSPLTPFRSRAPPLPLDA